jgi:hypothetical protein
LSDCDRRLREKNEKIKLVAQALERPLEDTIIWLTPSDMPNATILGSASVAAKPVRNGGVNLSGSASQHNFEYPSVTVSSA